jgi:hypothetical protein
VTAPRFSAPELKLVSSYDPTPASKVIFNIDQRLEDIAFNVEKWAAFVSNIDKSGKREGMIDLRIKEDHPKLMNDNTREDMSKTLSSEEARMDKRIDSLASEFRREMRLLDRGSRREANARNSALKAHVESNDRAVSEVLRALERTEGEFGKVKQANKEQRYWMAGIGVAIVLGIMGANATIFSGGKAFFDGGKEALQNQQRVELIIKQAQDQTEANRRILDEIRASQLSRSNRG